MATTVDNSIANRPAPVRVKRTVIPTPPAPTPPEEIKATNDAAVAEYPADFVRKPFGSHVQKLAYPERPGFHRHWFNDQPGRISRAMEAGYKHVTDRNGKNIARIVGTAEGGGGLNAYLMEIPLEWYRQDQAVKDKARDEVEGQIRRGIAKGHAPGQDGAYLPTNQAGTIGPDIKSHGR